MSTDAILDLTAAAVVFGSFVVCTNWTAIRNAIVRTHDTGSHSGNTARQLKNF